MEAILTPEDLPPNRGLLVDLADMTKIQLDLDSKVMTIQAGAKWGNATSELSRSGLNGYVLNGGRCVTVGVSGFILGGGIGPFTRSFGMGCDTLKEFTIVTADGSLITVKDTDNPHSPKGKLLWALCGAGGGNFGVVVELMVAVLKLQNKNESVMSSRFIWSPPEDEATFLSTMNRFYTTDFPDQLTINSSWLLELKRPSPKLNMRFLVYYDGDEKGFKTQITKSIIHKDLQDLLLHETISENSTLYLHETDRDMWEEETRRAGEENPGWSIYSSFCFTNDRETVEAITAIAQRELEDFKNKHKGSCI